MNHRSYLLQRIKREIPLPLLNMIFVQGMQKYDGVPITLDARITQEIILDILIMDMNVTAGKEEQINVQGCKVEHTTTGQIYKIGYGPTNGKEIMSVLDVGYGYAGVGSIKPTIASAVSDPMIVGDSRVQLVGKNTVYLDGYVGMPIMTMRVVLEHDSFLNDTNPRVLPFLAEAVILATKMYIYTNGGIRLKNAIVKNGEDLPYIEALVESYSDAASMYNDKMKEYIPISFMADKTAYSRHIRSIVPS